MLENDTSEQEKDQFSAVPKPEKLKSAKFNNDNISVVEPTKKAVTGDDAPEKYKSVKRMLSTLDRFLTQKLGLVVGICTLAIAGCSMGLFINNSIGANAGSSDGGSSGGSASATIDVFLWSSVALFAFIGILSMIYVFARLRARKKV